MNQDLIASASVYIDAPPAEVWEALVRPEAIKQYMFGTNVETDWQAREHSEENWQAMLTSLKTFLKG